MSSKKKSKGKPNPRKGKRAKQPGPKQLPVSKAPIAKSLAFKNGIAKITSLPGGSTRIQHREYFDDVTAASTAGGFDNQAYLINPGNPDMFPWLSKIAANYESYRFHKLHYIYNTSVGTVTQGKVVLTIDYDTLDSAPTNKVQALAFKNAVSKSAWEVFRHTSDIKDLQKRKSYFNLIGVLPEEADARLYHTGVLYAITYGFSAAGTDAGELYVEYDVEFMTPTVSLPPALMGGEALRGGGGYAFNLPFGHIPVYTQQSRGWRVVYNAGLSFNSMEIDVPGQYLLVCEADGSVGTDYTAAYWNPQPIGAASVSFLNAAVDVILGGIISYFLVTVPSPTMSSLALKVPGTKTEIFTLDIQMATGPVTPVHMFLTPLPTYGSYSVSLDKMRYGPKHPKFVEEKERKESKSELPRRSKSVERRQ